MNAASLQAAWIMFQETVNAPPSAEGHFKAAVLSSEPPDARPYVHGDPRVDRWQVAIGKGTAAQKRTEPTGMIPAGFEALAPWSPATHWPEATIWERPLRRLPAKEPDR